MPETPEKPLLRARLKGSFKGLVRIGLITVWVSFILSLTVRDYFSLTATFVYATPWLIQLTTAVFAFAILRKQLWWMSATLLLSGIYGAGNSGPEKAAFASPSPGIFTIATWNAGRELDNRRSEWHFESDVIAIIESGHFDKDQWRDFKATSPEYQWIRFDNGTMLGARGKLAKFETLGEYDLFRCFRVKVTVDKFPPFTVVVVDMRSQPWLSREGPMQRIFNAGKSGDPTIILGDFNTPPSSRWIQKNTKSGWSLANWSHSEGFIETWPHGLPLLCLDQIWVSDAFHAHHCRQETRPSDHRLVEAQLKFR